MALNLPLNDEYQTLGGFLLYQFQKLPVQGETLHHDDLELTVVSTEGPRLHQIRIWRREAPTALDGTLAIAPILNPTNAAQAFPEDSKEDNPETDTPSRQS